jgi:DNA-binding protein HU-beta
MNKQDLIDSMAKAAGITKVQAQSSLDAFMSSIQTALKKGDKVILVGFGTFSVTKRAARIGRNPQWKQGMPGDGTIKIPAKKVVKFKAGTGLQAKVK